MVKFSIKFIVIIIITTIIIIILLLYNNESYGVWLIVCRMRFFYSCWLSIDGGLIWAFLVPVVIIVSVSRVSMSYIVAVATLLHAISYIYFSFIFHVNNLPWLHTYIRVQIHTFMAEDHWFSIDFHRLKFATYLNECPYTRLWLGGFKYRN